MGSQLLVDAAVLASVAAVAVLLPGALRESRSGPAPDGTAGGRTSLRWHPGAALAVVTLLLVLNQVLVTVHVLRVHHGDPSFVARYLGPGWFDLADGSAVLQRLADLTPAPAMLAPSVLRVPALLELPFVLLAVLVALRRLDPGLYRRAARLRFLLPAAASYTLVFCVVEWELRNPYTADDLLLRTLSGLLVPPLLAAAAKRDDAPAVRPRSAAGLLLVLIHLGALGYLVLSLYGTVLLYNFGRADEAAPGAAVALLVLVAAERGGARTSGTAPPGGAVAFVGHGLWWFLALFWVPALAIRYGVTFGTPVLAAAAGLALVAAAAVLAAREVRTEAQEAGCGVGPLRRAVHLVAAAAAGVVAAGAAALPLAGLTYEAGLFAGGVAFLLTVLAVCTVADRASARRRETAASARRGAGTSAA
ncbi:hypothetical protein [Streptomyces sp. TR06-5]|uniref:hypothetical protein n=1 Tax=Streptomyces sp. TR06-5 TaxID=3385976 RepID=UPI0039A25552